jgi:hypothetical protein
VTALRWVGCQADAKPLQAYPADVMNADIRRGEYISGFFLRSGFWIDGIQILTSLGRRSPMYGNAHGGSSYVINLTGLEG